MCGPSMCLEASQVVIARTYLRSVRRAVVDGDTRYAKRVNDDIIASPILQNKEQVHGSDLANF